MNNGFDLLKNEINSISDESSTAYFKAIFADSKSGLLITSRQGSILAANPAACRMLGFSAEQLTAMSYFDLALNMDGFSVENDDSISCQHFRSATAHTVACLTSITAMRDEEGSLTGYIALMQKLSGQLEIHAELEKQRLELETLLNTLPMPVFFKDKDLKYRRANRAACDFLGLSQEQIIGRGDDELFPRETAEQIRQQDVLAMLERTLVITPDTPMADSNGNLHYFSIYKSPVTDESGQVAGLLDLALDVTERKLAESERLTMLQGQRDALVQEVHHRIKNHLQGVIGLLQRAISGKPALAEPIRGIMAQIESIAGIHGLQSRVGGQRLKFGQIATMIANLTPGCLTVSGDSCLDADLPHEEAVPFALTLNELVSNAFKHQRSDKSDRTVRLNLQSLENGLHIRVSSGPAHLPPEFDFAAGAGLGTGLRLLKSLLPGQGAKLHFFQDQDEVVAELLLTSPQIAAGISGCEQS